MSRSGRAPTPDAVIERGPDGLRAREFGPEPDVGHWEQLWEGQAGSYDQARAGHLPHQLRSTFGRLVRPPARVLEAGCGPAHFTVALRAQGYRAVGLDWGGSTLATVRRRVPGAPLSQGDVRRSPFRDASFDAVYSPGVCEHFEDGPDEVLADAFRVLRPGGVAVVSTPYLNRLRRRRWGTDRSSDEPAAFHQYLFAKDTLATTLQRLGFEQVQARPYATWATFTSEWPVLARIPAGRACGALDLVPLVREWGSTCIWTARKPSAARAEVGP